MAVARRGIHCHAHHALVAPGLPYGLRRSSVHEGQQARKGRRRSAERSCERQALHALPLDARCGQPSRSLEVPHASRGRARRGQVGAHQLGRGIRRDHREDAQGEGRVRQPIHRRRAWHGAQHRLAGSVFRLRLHGDAERLHVRVHRLRVLSAAHDRHIREVRRHDHRRRLAGPLGPLRQPRVEGAGRHPRVGQ